MFLFSDNKKPFNSVLPANRRTNKATKSFITKESNHFIYRFQPGPDEILTHYATEVLEKSYAVLGKLLNYYPKEKVLVEFYPSQEPFSKTSPPSTARVMPPPPSGRSQSSFTKCAVGSTSPTCVQILSCNSSRYAKTASGSGVSRLTVGIPTTWTSLQVEEEEFYLTSCPLGSIGLSSSYSSGANEVTPPLPPRDHGLGIPWLPQGSCRSPSLRLRRDCSTFPLLRPRPR